MAKRPTATAIAKISEAKEDKFEITSLNESPDYLQNSKSTGLEALGQSDFKIPRIKLLQPLSPEIRSFQGKAIPSEFWHTGSNTSLGTEFKLVPCIASKRVILWNPREEGGGMLAFSRDGKSWDTGANQKFSVKLKNVKTPVTWETGRDVQDSGLTEWGTYNPDDLESGPAAQISYEYLCYLIDYPDLSPVVMGMSRTSLTNAKNFNTSMLMLRKPIQSVMVRCFSDARNEGSNEWWVPNFELKGFVSKQYYDIAKGIADRQSNYNTEYHQEEPETDKSY